MHEAGWARVARFVAMSGVFVLYLISYIILQEWYSDYLNKPKQVLSECLDHDAAVRSLAVAPTNSTLRFRVEAAMQFEAAQGAVNFAQVSIIVGTVLLFVSIVIGGVVAWIDSNQKLETVFVWLWPSLVIFVTGILGISGFAGSRGYFMKTGAYAFQQGACWKPGVNMGFFQIYNTKDQDVDQTGYPFATSFILLTTSLAAYTVVVLFQSAWWLIESIDWSSWSLPWRKSERRRPLPYPSRQEPVYYPPQDQSQYYQPAPRDQSQYYQPAPRDQPQYYQPPQYGPVYTNVSPFTPS